jgi:hypothetical protein
MNFFIELVHAHDDKELDHSEHRFDPNYHHHHHHHHHHHNSSNNMSSRDQDHHIHPSSPSYTIRSSSSSSFVGNSNTIRTSNTHTTNPSVEHHIPWWRKMRSTVSTNPSDDLLSDRILKPSNESVKESSSKSTQQFESSSSSRLWTAVSLCLVFRCSHHIQQLKRCLEITYNASILPQLIAWEKEWRRKIDAIVPFCEEEEEDDGNDDDDGVEDGNAGGRKEFQPLFLCLEKLVSALCFECPTPIPGLLSVALELKIKDHNRDHDSDDDRDVLMNKACHKLSDEKICEISTNDAGNKNPVLLHSNGNRREKSVNNVMQTNVYEDKEQISTDKINNNHDDDDDDDSLHNRSSRAASTVERVTFTSSPIEDFPHCPYDIEILLSIFGPRTLIDIVCCVLSENNLLFHTTDLSLLPIICEGLRTLIYPLQWVHVYLPVAPKQLLSVLEAPVPFLLGTHTKWIKHIEIAHIHDLVLIDCDTASIDKGHSIAMSFPIREDRWLMMALKTLMEPSVISCSDDTREVSNLFLTQYDSSSSSSSSLPSSIFYRSSSCSSKQGYGQNHHHTTTTTTSTKTNNTIISNHVISNKKEAKIMNIATQIQLVFYDVIFHLLRYVPDCLFYLNPLHPVFNRSLFLSDYTSEEYRPTLEILTERSCFHNLTESIHTPSLAFFYYSILRLNTTEQEFVKNSFQNDDDDDNNENDNNNIGDDKSIHFSRAYRGG